ncbi:Pyridinium-3,5-bisthiocarboxylic acid mononucleotide nickel insertion protein [bioreactor metagenome]|uniref:Pyridinium-3,5-bisthiocarboxylic acid mononucleotide nickel insertion protein n=1 Tax=bioreactor metagenome TaxID=1076179 RepID=A0A644V675_9ZZZZ|nr:LarC family nickel insertion protein [Methanocorpusculum sp.]
MKTLFIDPRIGGISGAALTAALSDLGDLEDLRKNTADVVSGLKGEDPKKIMEKLGFSDAAKERAHAVFSDLESVFMKFHEGNFSITEILQDVLCPIAMLDAMDLLSYPIYATPPALGNCLPETLDICAQHRVPVSDNSTSKELTTPSGAALLAHLAVFRQSIPSMTPVKTRYAKEYGLLIVEGEVSDLTEERIVILETNIDDVSGEVIGYAVEKLLAAGAVDVFVTQGFGKKHRPVFMISVITTLERYRSLTEILMEETGTLGVRVKEEPRIVAERIRRSYPFTISGEEFSVRVKVSKHCGRVISVKPEFEDMKKAAQKLNIPLKDVAAEVQRQIPEFVEI